MSVLGFRPAADRVVIQRDESADKIGSIIVPDVAKEKIASGVVLAVGPGRRLGDGTLRPVEVNVGDRVLFERYSGQEIKIGALERLLVMHEDAVSGVEVE